MNRFDELTAQLADCDEAGEFAFVEESAAIQRRDHVAAALWRDLRRDAHAAWMRLHAERMELIR